MKIGIEEDSSVTPFEILKLPRIAGRPLEESRCILHMYLTITRCIRRLLPGCGTEVVLMAACPAKKAILNPRWPERHRSGFAFFGGAYVTQDWGTAKA